jgi:hypothetical protein
MHICTHGMYIIYIYISKPICKGLLDPDSVMDYSDLPRDTSFKHTTIALSFSFHQQNAVSTTLNAYYINMITHKYTDIAIDI